MYDVLYFSSNLLLTLMSTQLFVGSPTLLSTVADELKLSNPDTYNGPFSHNQPFLNYIYQLLDESEAAGSGSGTNTLQAKRFLSSLLTHITSKPTMGSSSLVTTMIGRYHGREHTVSAAAARLEAVVTALSADGDLSMSPDGEGGPAWALNEIFSTLGKLWRHCDHSISIIICSAGLTLCCMYVCRHVLLGSYKGIAVHHNEGTREQREGGRRTYD